MKTGRLLQFQTSSRTREKYKSWRLQVYSNDNKNTDNSSHDLQL